MSLISMNLCLNHLNFCHIWLFIWRSSLRTRLEYWSPFSSAVYCYFFFLSYLWVFFFLCVGMYAMRFYNKWILRKQAFYYSSLQISIKLINELHYRYSWRYFSYSFTPVCLSHLYNLLMFSSNKSSIMLSFVPLCLTILCPLSHLGVRMADWLCAYGSDTMGVVSARWR